MGRFFEFLQAHGALRFALNPWLNLADLRCEPMKTLTSILLVACLSVLPFDAKAQSEPPPPTGESKIVGALVLGVLVIAVGTVILTGLKKMCNKLPPLHAGTNAPPGDLTQNYHSLNDNDTATISSLMLQESPDLENWTEGYTFTFGDNMELSVFKAGRVITTNVPTFTALSNGDVTVYYDLRNIPLPQKPVAFFRLMSQ